MKPITSYPHFVRLTALISGLFVIGLSIVLQVNAGLGYAPWTVFSDGVSKHTGLTLGVSEIIVSFCIIAIDLIAREKIGLGTIANMYLCGTFLDLIRSWNIIPLSGSFGVSLLMLFASSILVAIGCFLYMGAGYGAGPRDTLMVLVMKLTGKPLMVCRTAIEFSALAVGYLLGGSVGIGTLIQVATGGFIIGHVFKLLGCDAKEISHTYLIKPKK